jgi:hypothetical protein
MLKECFVVPWFFLCKSWPLSGSCGHKNLRWCHRMLMALVPWVDLSQAYTCLQYLHVEIGSCPPQSCIKMLPNKWFLCPNSFASLMNWRGRSGRASELLKLICFTYMYSIWSINCWSWPLSLLDLRWQWCLMCFWSPFLHGN